MDTCNSFALHFISELGGQAQDTMYFTLSPLKTFSTAEQQKENPLELFEHVNSRSCNQFQRLYARGKPDNT